MLPGSNGGEAPSHDNPHFMRLRSESRRAAPLSEVMELAEPQRAAQSLNLRRPRGLRETSPQLRRFLIFGRGLYGDGKATHHGHGGQQGWSQRRFGMLVVQHPVWDHGS